MSKRAGMSLKRLQRKRKNRSLALHKERVAYLEGNPPPRGYNKVTGQPVWTDGVKSLFPSRATGKLACNSPSREHDWVLSKGKTFHRCSHCKISTYHHQPAVAAA